MILGSKRIRYHYRQLCLLFDFRLTSISSFGHQASNWSIKGQGFYSIFWFSIVLYECLNLSMHLNTVTVMYQWTLTNNNKRWVDWKTFHWNLSGKKTTQQMTYVYFFHFILHNWCVRGNPLVGNFLYDYSNLNDLANRRRLRCLSAVPYDSVCIPASERTYRFPSM